MRVCPSNLCTTSRLRILFQRRVCTDACRILRRTVPPLPLCCGGSFFIGNSKVSVAYLGILLGVSKLKLGSCTFALRQLASFPMQVTDAAESKKAVLLLGRGGASQLGVGSSHTFTLLTIKLPAAIRPHSPLHASAASSEAFANASAFLFLFSIELGQFAGTCHTLALQCLQYCCV